jgi:Fic family protein
MVGDYRPPEHYRVPALMDDFVNEVNRAWQTSDPVVLASYVLWKMNHIHPFINGNGRTARAACYFVLCVKAGGWLPGEVILPELIRQHREEYVAALKHADAAAKSGSLGLEPLHALLSTLLNEQIGASPAPPDTPAAEPCLQTAQ